MAEIKLDPAGTGNNIYFNSNQANPSPVLTPATSLIPAANLNPVAPITIAPTPAPDNVPQTVIAGSLQDLQNKADSAQKTADTLLSKTSDTANPDSVASQILSLMGQENNKTADTQAAMESSGATALAKQLNDLNTQAKNLNLEAQAIPIQTQENNRNTGATDAGVAPQTAGALRQNALKALSISQQANIALGNYTAAADTAQRMIDVKYQPIEAQLATLQQQYNFNKDFLQSVDKKAANAFQLYLNKQASDVADAKAKESSNSNLANTYAKAAIDNGQADLAAKFQVLDPASKDFTTNLADLQSQMTPDALRTLDIENKRLANAKLRQEIANGSAVGGVGGNGIASLTDYSSFLASRTPDQVKAFNAVPDGEKASIMQLINGDALLTDIVKSRGATTQAQINRIISEAVAIDPTFSVNTNKIRYSFLQGWNDPNGKTSITRNAINTALGHLADFKQSADALDPGTVRRLNNVKNILTTETGDPKVLQLRTDINALASEIATVYKGSAPTEKEITNWEDTIAADFSKRQYQGVSDEISKLLTSKITATRYQYKSTMGFDYNQSIIDPDKRQALIDAGINPDNVASEKVPGQTSAQDLLNNPLSKGIYGGATYSPDVWANAK